MRQRIRGLERALVTTAGTALCFLVLSQAAGAFQIDTGTDVKISWDNTLKYSAAMRLGSRSDALTDASRNSSNVDQDDGDRNFDQGLISNRLDLLSELDASFKGFGIRLSGAAWYDTMYFNAKNHNDSRETANSYSVSHNEFTQDTQDLHGRKAEMLDTFAYGKVVLGPTNTTFRIGKFAQTWGESLFYGGNGVAGGMGPVDIVKLLSVPNSQFKEILMPVRQATAQLQIGPYVSMGGYYQFEWEKSRLPAAGSYFSQGDILDDGGERLIASPSPFGGPALAFFRKGDQQAKDLGQGGLQLKVRPGLGVDLGFYALRYHDKTPQVYLRPGLQMTETGPPVVVNPSVLDMTEEGPDLSRGKIGEYLLTYPENIQSYGMSATTTFGSWNLAAEVSMRRNAPLVSDGQAILPAAPPYFPGINPNANNSDNAAYAVGRTVHAQFNWLASFGPSFLSNEASFLGEVAWNRVTSIQDNPDAVAGNAERSAWGFRMIYEPTYRQVAPGLDLSVPVGVSYSPHGKSMAVGGFGTDKGGDMNIGLNASYLDVWRFSLTYTHFYGPKGGLLDAHNTNSFKQSLADRDFLAFSARRTF